MQANQEVSTYFDMADAESEALVRTGDPNDPHQSFTDRSVQSLASSTKQVSSVCAGLTTLLKCFIGTGILALPVQSSRAGILVPCIISTSYGPLQLLLHGTTASISVQDEPMENGL